jgi:hypothetical protein
VRRSYDEYRRDAVGKYDRPVWGGGAPLFGTGATGFGTTWGHTEPTPKPNLAGRGPKAWKRADRQIHEEVCERLADHPHIDATDIEVSVDEGEVTLAGTVDDRDTKWSAEDCALEVHGVRDIHNRLRLRPRVESFR